MDAATIERWISVIEDNDFITDKDKRVENLINLWKFSSCLDNDAHITNDGLLNVAAQTNAAVTFTDMCLRSAPKSDYINNIFSAITPVLNTNNFAYYVELHEQKNNFTATKLLHLEEEIINAIQGRLVPYSQVKKITKLNAKAGLYTNTTIKNCTRADINTTLKQAENTNRDGQENWLVLVLDRLVSQCDSFYISDDILHLPFETGYDRLFLFDFYKGEVTELSTGL